jgi:hypothetical protein
VGVSTKNRIFLSIFSLKTSIVQQQNFGCCAGFLTCLKGLNKKIFVPVGAKTKREITVILEKFFENMEKNSLVLSLKGSFPEKIFHVWLPYCAVAPNFDFLKSEKSKFGHR